jgi:hypothetical protein
LQFARTMRTPLACSLLLAVNAAHAAPPELALGQEQMALEPTRDVMSDDPAQQQVPWNRTAMFAQLTGGGRARGDVGVGIATSMSGIGCELVNASAQGRLRPLAEDGASAVAGELRYGICPIATFITVKLDGYRNAGLVPSLDARRSLWNRGYVDVYDRVMVGFGPVWGAADVPRHTIMVFEVGHGTTAQQDESDVRKIKSLGVGLVLYRFEAPEGLQLDAIAFESTAMKAGTDNRGGVTSAFMPVRLRWNSPELFATASAGWGFTGGSLSASGSTEVNDSTVSSWSDTIVNDGLPSMSMVIADLEAGMRRDRIQVSARGARTYFPTFDGNLAREARVSADLTYVAGASRRTTISLSPFATRTRTWTRDAGSARDRAVGATLRIGRELSTLHVADRATPVRIDALAQAGVSPYAHAETERLPTSSFGGQVLVAISGRTTQLRR